jgi:hypothetical protein
MNNTEDCLEKHMALDYIRANIAHEFRTQFTTIDVSLHSLQAILPALIDAYSKARNTDSVDVAYSDDYLRLLCKSVSNSIKELKSADFYLNKLLVFLNKDKLGSGLKEKISMRSLLEEATKKMDRSETYLFNFESNGDFDIEYNIKEMTSCISLLIMDIYECQKDLKSPIVIMEISPDSMQLSFVLVKFTPKPRIYNHIVGFMGGNHSERYGVGVYLFNKLVETQLGKVHLLEDEDTIKFNIQF